MNPDEVVAIGAAIQAGILAGEIKDILLIDVTPLSLGVETIGGLSTKMISRNTTIPVKKSDIFSTADDDQPEVYIHILQGERELVSGNKSLGKFKLENIPPAQRGIPQIEVTFDIDVDGMLSVSAKEKKTGVQQSITIENASTLNENEISQMLEDAEKYASRDQETKKFIKLKNESELLCFEAKKELTLLEGIGTKGDQEEVKELITILESKVETTSIESNLQELEIANENLKVKMGELLSKYGDKSNTQVDPNPNSQDF